MFKVAIIQPSIENYRISFYRHIGKAFDIEVFHSSKDSRDKANIINQISLYCDFKKIALIEAIGIIFIQNIFSLPKKYKKGDVIVISGNLRYLNLIPLILNSKLRGIKIVWWSHKNSTKKISSFIREAIYKKMDSILFYTECEVRDYINTQSSMNQKNKVFSLDNSIDTFAHHKILKQISLEDVGKVNNKNFNQNKTIVFCGRLTKKSNIELLIKSMCLVQDIDSEIKLIIIGKDPDDYYLKMSQALKVSNVVIFVGEVYCNIKLARWMSKSSFFVYPGNIGLSIMTAFSHNLPILVHNNSKKHMPEYCYFSDRYNGASFKYGSEEDLSEKICFLMKNQNMIKVFSENAYKTSKKYNISRMSKNFIEACMHASKAKSGS